MMMRVRTGVLGVLGALFSNFDSVECAMAVVVVLVALATVKFTHRRLASCFGLHSPDLPVCCYSSLYPRKGDGKATKVAIKTLWSRCDSESWRKQRPFVSCTARAIRRCANELYP
ncbi:hypothetical protein BC835DRAFT_418191 [Cytidiella melzeri]|nr:hypothetical protein BC835DRAFT_418191 [Cytidiella melzeri]